MASLSSLPSLVRDKFHAAREAGDLTFYDTQVSLVKCQGVSFQVRYSPALANKPKSNKPRGTNKSPPDPFENPEDGLLVTSTDSHFIVLNKFPVIPDHFILATKEYKLQTDILDESDIYSVSQCVEAYDKNGEALFAFYNSGEHSGASQPHRHIQFLPVNSMRSGLAMNDNWDILTDVLLRNPGLPFMYFVSNIPDGATSKDVYGIYLSLYEKACQACGVYPAGFLKRGSLISYNLGVTKQAMVICPRKSEGIKIENESGELVGPVSLNGTVLGGTLLVKSKDEWDCLRNDQSKLLDVLASIGVPSGSEEQGRL